MIVGVDIEGEVVCLLTRFCSCIGSASNDLLTLAGDGMQVRVVVLLLVLKTTEVEDMKEVTPFLAATVTVGPAGIVKKKVVVLVIPFGVEVLRQELVRASNNRRV